MYGWAMTESLPLDNFQNMIDDEIADQQRKFDLISSTNNETLNIPNESSEGYIFVAKLEFPIEVQKKLLSYPLVPEQMLVEEDMLSKSQLDTYETLFGTKYTNKSNKKMVNSFEDKMEYTVHYRNLAFYCSLGVKATLIRGYKFRQSKFIAPYVNLCTSKRKEADSDFDKNIWKAMNNIVFGKVIEDITKRVDIRYYNSFEKMDSCLKSHPDAKTKIINENLVQVAVKKRSMKITQPIHIGFTILEVSKLAMARFWYKTILPTFHEENVKLLYSGNFLSLIHI